MGRQARFPFELLEEFCRSQAGFLRELPYVEAVSGIFRYPPGDIADSPWRSRRFAPRVIHNRDEQIGGGRLHLQPAGELAFAFAVVDFKK